MGIFFQMIPQQTIAERIVANMVAYATPGTPIWKTATKRMFKKIFNMLVTINTIMGVTESPKALDMEFPILYSAVATEPTKIITR